MSRVLLALPLLALVTIAAALAFNPAPPPQDKSLFEGAQIDTPTLALFARACQNCHSDNTRWPWYSRVPPLSWAIAKDVDDAKRHINFSSWASYPQEEQQEFLTRIGNAARTGQMPLPRYTLLHRDAILAPQERQQIYDWTKSERKRLRTFQGVPTSN